MYDKRVLFEKLCDLLAEMIRGAATVRMVSEAESRAHKGAMSSRFDTFKEEAQALAGGHGKREMNLNQELARIRALSAEARALRETRIVQPGAVVLVKDQDKGDEVRYFVVNAAGGLEIAIGDTKFISLNWTTPLGRALLRKEVGDSVELLVEARCRQLEILEIQ